MNIYRLGLMSVLLVTTGCATKDYVGKQINSVACRVDVLEIKTTSLESRVDALESLVDQAQLANKAMLDEATVKAMESAQRAEAAATAADFAAQRAEKMFELGQKK